MCDPVTTMPVARGAVLVAAGRLREVLNAPVDDGIRPLICDLVAMVTPLDAREAEDRRYMLECAASGAPLFRVEKPAVPPRHLAVYSGCLMTPAGQ